jgi:FKBP-type peptidyl-prolyl cis-trans isomerase FkpA
MITPMRVFIVAAVIGVGVAVVVAMHQKPAPAEVGFTEAASLPAITEATGTRRVMPSGLVIIGVKPGAGPAAKNGDHIWVNYTGRLYYGGKKFDSSYDRHKPYDFVLGKGAVIKGWDEGLVGMKAGGKRELIIPSGLAYGAGGSGGVIPPYAKLVFDVEMVSINKKPAGAATQP